MFAGTPEPAVPSLRRLIESPDHEVVGVITRPDARSGRGRKVVRSPVGALADSVGIDVITPARLSDADSVEHLTAWAPDCCAVVAYGALVPASLLDLPRYGWINLHFSLLPAWRGAAPVQAAIAAGDEITGASTFQIEAGLDTGPVFGSVTEPIAETDTSGDLLARLADSGSQLLVSTLDGLERGELVGVAQPADGVSIAPKTDVAGARVRWDRPAHVVDRHIRSATPTPGAWTQHGNVRLRLGPVSRTDADPIPTGALSVGKKSVLVGTASAPVALGWVQPPGRRAMPAADWARGAHVESGEMLS